MRAQVMLRIWMSGKLVEAVFSNQSLKLAQRKDLRRCVSLLYIISYRIDQSLSLDRSIAIEGWIVFITNVHPEAQEEDIVDKFSDYGTVKNINVNLDRRTGFVKVSASPIHLNARHISWYLSMLFRVMH
jgi:hypothetical protein